MKSEDKNQLLNRLEVAVNNHLQQALLLQNKHTDVLLKPAATGGWSIAQCLEHLNRYGHYYLPAMQEQITKSKPQKISATFTQHGWAGTLPT